jgi:uncharacterized Zn finger protein (UPF0148 family)
VSPIAANGRKQNICAKSVEVAELESKEGRFLPRRSTMRQEMSPHKCKTRLLILLAGAVVCASCREVPITEPVKRGEDGQREQIGDQRPKLPEQSLSSVGSEFDEKVRALSIALGSESWDEREHATDMLISLGEKARKWLSAAETAIDPEKASRARFVCKAISLAHSGNR